MAEEYIRICEEAREKATQNDVVTAKVIYDNIFARDPSRYRDWETASYQAPETSEGFAFHLCLYTAVQIREKS